MPTKKGSGAPVAGRRKFLKTAGLTGVAAAATIAMPQISRAQTQTWKYQSTWPTKDIFHEFAVDYANVVNNLSGGRLKLDVLAAGAVVPAFQLADAVHSGVLEAGHGVCAYWYGKHKAYSLFGTPPSFGWDANGFLAWFYNGGGEALYKELVNDTLKLNLTGYLYFPMPTQPLGWFKKEMKTGDDFKGMKYRTVGLSADVFKEMGAAVTILPGGEIVPAMDRGLLDSAEFNNPSSDILLGFPDVAKYFMLGSHHQQMEAFEVIFNKQKVEALPKELQQVLRYAAHASSSEQIYKAYDRYSTDLEAIKKRGVNVVKTPPAVLNAQLDAWTKVIAEQSKEPFFAKVIASQRAWVKKIYPYLSTNNLDSVALDAGFKKLAG
ncbi:MAG: TRAP transporter substrate-binding protein DctP [Xanthobacteraceae bacterium]|nr:TRAP transporter substrate-binding protein DctP [Xanthobacteraceae bacterium]QYK45761.1 MAG: TRAP transporter substrate-binding protein DctP [Xanthobacteraceae bacterium]